MFLPTWPNGIIEQTLYNEGLEKSYPQNIAEAHHLNTQAKWVNEK